MAYKNTLIVRIREKSFVARLAAHKLKAKTMAVTLGNTVYLHGAHKADFLANTCWARHEVAHVLQYKRLGFLKFIFLYFFQSISKGYYNSPLEQEAREAEQDVQLLDRVTFR